MQEIFLLLVAIFNSTDAIFDSRNPTIVARTMSMHIQ